MNGSKTATKPIGVVLLQLGGPDSLESVEPFLNNLFCDPEIIDLPLAFLFRRRLARFISKRRAPKVQVYYKKIGGKSPILKLTLRQARALEQVLRGVLDARVYVAMRYWHPLTDEVLETLKNDGINQAILVPLYPQYSKTTTGSSVNEWERIRSKMGMNDLSVKVVYDYCEHPLYVDALVHNIGIALRRLPEKDRGKVHLVFSAHGTPVKLVKKGDPYQQQIIKTYDAVLRKGNFGLTTHLCYQSKVGPEKWLEPSLITTVETLASQKVSHVIVVPIAFVSDHSETLWEINIEVRKHALGLGIKYYDMSPALNTNPSFIRGLADVVLKAVS
jgi:ferrochelatase